MLRHFRSGLRPVRASALILLLVAACSSSKSTTEPADASPDATPDATPDGPRDGGHDARDAAHPDGGPKADDAGSDGKTTSEAAPPVEAATDGNVGSGDAVTSFDAGHDAVVDAVIDTGVDATSPPPDATPPPRMDATPPPVDTGPPPFGTYLAKQTLAVNAADGVHDRTYDIFVPTACSAASPLPLVFVFHGDGGNGNGMRNEFPIEAAAQAAGGAAIFVYPDGTDNHVDSTGAKRAWDLYHDPGPSGTSSPFYSSPDPVPADSDQASGNVDVDFIDQMIATFEANYCVDPNRIYFTGMSNGGYAANQFGRWRSNVVHGIASMSGAAPFGNLDGTGDWTPPNYCIGSTDPVPTLIIHGEADTSVDPCNAIEEQAYWELTNGCANSANNCTANSDSCTGSNLTPNPPDPTTTSGLSASGDCVAADSCASPVVLCLVPGLQHKIWSEAPTVVWQFFAGL